MELQVGDRLVDETGEWEITVRPYTSPGGKNVHARVRRTPAPIALGLYGFCLQRTR
jgi:hypothetical protein